MAVGCVWLRVTILLYKVKPETDNKESAVFLFSSQSQIVSKIRFETVHHAKVNYPTLTLENHLPVMEVMLLHQKMLVINFRDGLCSQKNLVKIAFIRMVGNSLPLG